MTSPLASGYTNITPFQHMDNGMQGVAAFKSGTRELYAAVFDGSAWGSAVIVDTLGAGASKSIAAWQEAIAGSARLRIVVNGSDYCSDNYGDSWQVTT